MSYRNLVLTLWLALFVCLLSAVKSNAQGSQTTNALSAPELQAALMSFADSWASQITEASQAFAKRAQTDEARYHAHKFQFYSLAAAFDIAAGAYPGPALLDMLVLVSLSRLVWEEHWQPKVYGDPAAIVVRELKQREAEIWSLAAKVMTPEQRRELRELIRQWRETYPHKVGVSFIRFSNFGELGRKPYLEQARKSGGLLAPVKEAVKAADEIRSLADRAIYLLFRMQELLSARAMLSVEELLANPEIARLLTDINGFRVVSERYADILEVLPEQLAEQTRTTIDQVTVQIARQSDLIVNRLMQQVETERQAALEQALQGIASERQATLEQLLQGVATEREATLGQVLQGVTHERQALALEIAQILDRGTQSVGAWLTLLFVLVAALVLIVFLLRLAYRFAVDASDGHKHRRIAVSTGLTIAAISIVIVVFVYVNRELPTSFAMSGREQKTQVDHALNGLNHGPADSPARRQTPPAAKATSTAAPASTPSSDVTMLPQSDQPSQTSMPLELKRPPDASGMSMQSPENEKGTTASATHETAIDQPKHMQVHFAPGEWSLAPSANEKLHGVLARLRADESLRLDIQGHSDSQGSDRLNLQLSEKRAEAVKGYLVQNGIAPQRLTAVGCGASHPAASNATAEGRSQNRRVVIKFAR